VLAHDRVEAEVELVDDEQLLGGGGGGARRVGVGLAVVELWWRRREGGGGGCQRVGVGNLIYIIYMFYNCYLLFPWPQE
jgi:hypothetical protein